jgi:hypothetical protein
VPLRLFVLDFGTQHSRIDLLGSRQCSTMVETAFLFTLAAALESIMPGRFRMVSVIIALFIAGTWVSAQLRSITLSGSFDGYDFLLLNDSVQKEIKLSDEQIIKAKEIIRAIRMKHRPDMEECRKLAPPAGSEKLREVMYALSGETLEKLTAILQPEQVNRLKQIKLQNEGLRAFAKADIVKELSLTETQKQEIKKIQEGLDQESQEAFQAGTRGNYQEAMARIAKHRREAVQKAVKRLTPEQTRIWKNVAGEPFDIKYQSPALQRAAEQEKKSGTPDK